MSPISNNRRQFFQALATATATANALAQTADDPVVAPAPMSDRKDRARAVHGRLTDFYYGMDPVEHPANGDEDLYPGKINSFHKTLLHIPNGQVSLQAYRSLIKAVDSGKAEDFDLVVRGGNVRLKNPTGAYNFQLTGADPSQYTMPVAPTFASATQAAEMVELYWQALTRDIPFAEYEGNSLINGACNELSNMQGSEAIRVGGRVTPKTIFRGPFPGELNGPYLSQFLMRPFMMGSVPVEIRQRAAVAGQEFLLEWRDWFGIQLGEGKGPGNKHEETTRYIRNGRDLATFVHFDSSYSPHYNAVWQLLSFGADAYTEANPYVKAKGQEPYVNFGTPDSLAFVAAASKPAFNAAWFQKWFVHRRARPEAFGGRIFQHVIGNEAYPIHAQVLESRALQQSYERHGTYLLPQAYSEACPAHSSYPSGHATVAGATITMLKAFFKESFVIPDPVVASADGTKLERYIGGDLTVGNELNKLAFNIANGRNWAGIHWRSDATEGMLLGERVAIEVLRTIRSTMLDDFAGFTFTRFNGEKITIQPV